MPSGHSHAHDFVNDRAIIDLLDLEADVFTNLLTDIAAWVR